MIDLIFVDISYVSESGVLLDMIADHFPIYLIKKKQRNLKAHKFIKGRTYKRYHTEIFQEMNDPRKFWRAVNSNFGIGKHKNSSSNEYSPETYKGYRHL